MTGDTLILTDDGYTIRDLELSGFKIAPGKREQVLHTILNGFGASLQGDEIIVEARTENFPKKKHNIIQAMLAVNDLFAQPLGVIYNRIYKDGRRGVILESHFHALEQAGRVVLRLVHTLIGILLGDDSFQGIVDFMKQLSVV